MTTLNRDIGALISVGRALANTALTAGGTGDNTEIVGAIIDRRQIGFPQSAVLAIPFTATLGVGQTLTIAYSVETGDASNLSGAEVLQSATAVVVATGPSGGGTVTGVHEVDVPLRGAKSFLRVKATPDLNRANTDTAAVSGVLVFGGADRVPQ